MSAPPEKEQRAADECAGESRAGENGTTIATDGHLGTGRTRAIVEAPVRRICLLYTSPSPRD